MTDGRGRGTLTEASILAAAERRERAWAAALGPAEGATFDVYVQNPFAGGGDGEAYRKRLAVSRGTAPGDPRAIRIAPLDPADPNGPEGFGDDEIYVANYQDRKPYDTDRPYYFPAGDPGFVREQRPPSARPTDLSGLRAFAARGCFHCVERAPLTGDASPLLAERPKPVRAPAYGVAMTYALARRTLDVWKVYLRWGKRYAAALRAPIPWHFRAHRPRLEIVPFLWEVDGNGLLTPGIASSGYGYVQLGAGPDTHHGADLDIATIPGRATDPGPALRTPYWLNPDVLSHEIGHQLLYATLGFGPGTTANALGPEWTALWRRDADPDPDANGTAFRAFHEAFADIVAVIAGLHAPGFLTLVLRETGGDLFTVNAATSVGELSARKTLRNSLNERRLADVGPPRRSDPPQRRYYELAPVVSGALFDVLAGFAARYLARYDVLDGGAVSAWLASVAPDTPAERAIDARLRRRLLALYARPNGPALIEAAIRRARDALGRLLGAYLARKAAPGGFDPAAFTLAGLARDLAEVALAEVAVDLEDGGPAIPANDRAAIVRDSFAWRGIA